MIDNNGLTAGDSLDGVARVGWNDRHHARASDMGHAIDGEFEFAFEDFIDFLFRMGVFVDGRTAFEIIVRERHGGGMEVAAEPSGQAFDYFQTGNVHEGHATNLSLYAAHVWPLKRRSI